MGVLDIPEILREGYDEFREFVNPMIAQRAAMAGEPVRLKRAEGGHLIDEGGRPLEDFHGTQMLGHRQPAVAAALVAFLESDAPSWYPTRVSPFAGRLARRLSERTGYERTSFACSGADAVEAALKLARAATGRPRILGLQGGYHGCTFGAVSLMEKGPFRDPFAPHLPGAESLPWDDAGALERALAAGDVGAVLVEPIQGEGGVRALSDGYVAALCELTRKHDALLIADEVQTGLGRGGRGLQFTAGWPRRPDVVLLAKALGGGLMPISAMLTRADVFHRAYGKNFEAGEAHNQTFSYNALAMVAGLATLELLTDAVFSRVHELGGIFKRDLQAALTGLPLFQEMRGQGFMLGIKLDPAVHPWLSFEHFGYPELARRSTIAPLLAHRLYRRGWFCFACGHDWSVLRLQPRFDLDKRRLDDFVADCRAELEYLCSLA